MSKSLSHLNIFSLRTRAIRFQIVKDYFYYFAMSPRRSANHNLSIGMPVLGSISTCCHSLPIYSDSNVAGFIPNGWQLLVMHSDCDYCPTVRSVGTIRQFKVLYYRFVSARLLWVGERESSY